MLLFHELSEYINFFCPKNEGVPHLQNCWPRLKNCWPRPCQKYRIRSEPTTLLYTYEFKIGNFLRNFDFNISTPISISTPKFRFRSFQFRRITTNENSQKICKNHEKIKKLTTMHYLIYCISWLHFVPNR